MVSALLFGGCKKDKDSDPVPPAGSNGVGAVPSSFTQKAFLEEATGAWCGWCTDGAYKMEQIIAANSGKVIGASLHQGDAMEIPLYNALDAVFNNSSFPAGMVSRVAYNGSVFMSRGSWSSAANAQLLQVAKCGVAIESSLPAPDSCSVTVHCGFLETFTGDYRVTVYLLEDEVTGSGSQYNQQNYLSGNANYQNTPYYSQPSVITGYKHMHVVRKVLSSNLGDPIPASGLTAGSDHKVTYGYKIPASMNPSKMKVVAFITKHGTSSTTHRVMNVNEVHLGQMKNWD